MGDRECPGLPADWLNGWLAAVGCTVLVPTLTLAWSLDAIPYAVLSADEGDPADLVAGSLPSEEDVASWPIARKLEGGHELALNAEVPAWAERSALVRRVLSSGWTLSALYSDLCWDRSNRIHVVGRGQFVTPMPGRDNTVHDRLRKLAGPARQANVARTLDGTGERIANNGLGFDIGRLGSLADETEMTVDPVIEMLAYHALALFPVRGDGDGDARQRGWTGRRGDAGGFRWPTWSTPLDADGIDALLDCESSKHALLGVTGWWEAVPFERRGSSDVTRAYGSQRRQRQP